jgi:hypothetical protein
MAAGVDNISLMKSDNDNDNDNDTDEEGSNNGGPKVDDNDNEDGAPNFEGSSDDKDGAQDYKGSSNNDDKPPKVETPFVGEDANDPARTTGVDSTTTGVDAEDGGTPGVEDENIRVEDKNISIKDDGNDDDAAGMDAKYGTRDHNHDLRPCSPPATTVTCMLTWNTPW